MRARVTLLLLIGATATAQDGDAKTSTVGPLAPDAARDARIEDLISKLVDVSRPWHGISATSGGGTAFDALDTGNITATALTELPSSGPPVPFRELVRLGPAAIPALLKHLDDRRETKLSFHREEDGFGGMFEQPELFAGSAAERALIVRTLGAKGLKNPTEDEDEAPDSRERMRDYSVTVGDCCFAILGQIVNREYEAVRYQPTLIAIISSPTGEPRIAEVLRAMWGHGDPRQVLALSLHDDLRHSRDPADEAGAAARLLFYFPDELARAVASCIAEFPWGDYPSRQRKGEELLRAAMSTGHVLIRAEWLRLLDAARPAPAQLAALAVMTSDPGEDVRERIRAMLDQPSDLDVVVACIAASPGEKAPVAFAWLKEEFGKQEKRDAEKTQVILSALAALDEEQSIPIFLAHIEKLTNFGWGNVLVALGKAPRPNLATAILRARLDGTELVLPPRPVPMPRWVMEETRWCDLAAAVLAHARPEFAFDRQAAVEERDRQIAAIRAALAK